MKINRYSYDIEVTPNIGVFWQPSYSTSITYDQILQERQIICLSAKKEGGKVFNLAWDAPKDLKDFIFGKNDRDRKIIEEFAKIARETDDLVAHNGDRFDWKWITARAIRLGIEMPKEIVSTDTLKEAKKHFRFNSNRLDYLAQYLGVGGKTNTGGLQLWKDVISGDKKALSKMVRYCNNDVIILEKVFNKLKPYIKNKTAVSDDRMECAECGKRMSKQRERRLASGLKKVVLHCEKCGKYKTIPLSKYEKEK